jgi:hypothetical protein
MPNNYRPGSIRYFDQVGGDYVVVDPHNRMYSTALFVATEYWDDKAQEWKSLEVPEADSEGGNA